MKNVILNIKDAIISRLHKMFPDPTEIEEIVDDATTIKKYVNNKKNRKKAIKVAEGIYTDFRHNFELKHLIKKYNAEPNAIVAQLQMLGLFQLCSSRLNDKGKTIFRITLSPEDRIEVLKEKLAELAVERDQIVTEIANLQK